MRVLVCTVALLAMSAPAMAAPQGPPMTEPTPMSVALAAGQVRDGHIARPQAMGQTTHAIMMPHPRMPARAQRPASGSSQGTGLAAPHP